jgi:hypothetical protein
MLSFSHVRQEIEQSLQYIHYVCHTHTVTYHYRHTPTSKHHTSNDNANPTDDLHIDAIIDVTLDEIPHDEDIHHHSTVDPTTPLSLSLPLSSSAGHSFIILYDSTHGYTSIPHDLPILAVSNIILSSSSIITSDTHHQHRHEHEHRNLMKSLECQWYDTLHNLLYAISVTYRQIYQQYFNQRINELQLQSSTDDDVAVTDASLDKYDSTLNSSKSNNTDDIMNINEHEDMLSNY